MTFHKSRNVLEGKSEKLTIEFDLTTGRVIRLTNVVTGQELAEPSPGHAWRATPQGVTSSVLPDFTQMAGFEGDEILPDEFRAEVTQDGASLFWTADDPSITVEVSARFSTDGSLELWPTVRVSEGSLPPAHFTYPIFVPRPLGSDDRLLFPAHSGWLINQPLGLTTEGVYPDGYGGCSVQMMAYFADRVGGFSIECQDPFVTHKSLLFEPGETSIRHDAWDLGAGADLDLGYPVVITALVRGDWHEAADHYRTWAETTPWAEQGPNSERTGTSRPRWIYEDVGLSVWGGSSTLDWSARYGFLADSAGTPLHIVAGWDWPAETPFFRDEDAWFPARFHPANIDAWRDHHVTPYLNDLFVSTRARDFFEEWEPNLIYPYKYFPFAQFSERPPGFDDLADSEADPKVLTDIAFFTCPTTEQQRAFHVRRDTRLVSDYDLDGVFYDISSGNPFAARCLRSRHGHTPGWSREVLEAYARNNHESRAGMQEVLDRPPAQGVETIVEHIIGDIDFYVSRAAAGPLGVLEAGTLGPETPPGDGRELVPLFQAIYHDIGPVHEDGWLTLADDVGDIFYWVAARIALQWGGILSLHYANNPPEALPGLETAEIVAWDGGAHRFTELRPPHQGHIAFMADLAELRTGEGKPFLGYGRMLRPLDIESPTVELDYYRRLPVMHGITQRGTWNVPQVVHSAWRSPDGRLGLFFSNVGPEAVRLRDNASPEGWTALPVSMAVEEGVGSLTVNEEGAIHLAIDLAPHSTVMVELESAG